MLTADVAAFRADGFIVLPHAFDPGPLAAEVDRALTDAFRGAAVVKSGSAGNAFSYVPMMVESTPLSLAMIDALAPVAADLLRRDVIPVRAKGTRYLGSTDWHRDSDQDLASVGFVGYLDALDGDTGALRVVPGSHRSPGDPANERAIATAPGDVIAIDEHLLHSSVGGHDRRQWRVDFLGDPIGNEEEARARAYFAGIFLSGWDGGYDVDRYPSYDDVWRHSDRPWTHRLAALGVYDLADAEEAAVRSARR